MFEKNIATVASCRICWLLLRVSVCNSVFNYCNIEGMLGIEHVLCSARVDRASQLHQVPHIVLPVGPDHPAGPGVPLLPAVRRLASLQRAVRNQYQQPGRRRRHHPECTVP